MTKQIEKIKKEVLEYHEWIDLDCWFIIMLEEHKSDIFSMFELLAEEHNNDLSKAIELAIQKTAQAIFGDLKKHVARDIEGKKTGDIILLKDEFEELKKKWGVEL